MMICTVSTEYWYVRLNVLIRSPILFGELML